MITPIRFKGDEYFLVSSPLQGSWKREGAITTGEAYMNGDYSYAHLCPDGTVLRYFEVIGTIDDIEFGESMTSSEFLKQWRENDNS